MKFLRIFLAALAISGLGFAGWVFWPRPWDVLSPGDRATLDSILKHWESWVPARQKEGTAPLLTFEELYAGLGESERGLLDRVRAIRPKNRVYVPPREPGAFRRIDGQHVLKNGDAMILDSQYLPEPVFQAYERMMAAMQKELGKRLFVESGYRSPAYQLYTFLFFMPKHFYSIRETREWVALPGYSEHGNPARQAIDFVNQEGVNGDERPEDFEVLPEFAWLGRHAREFGFELSYPRGTPGSAYEPWHWRYVGPS